MTDIQLDDLDKELVEELKRSREVVGELQPVIVDQDGNILTGRHRKAASPSWHTTQIFVKNEKDRLLKKIHLNVQHRPSEQETRKNFLELAKLLEKEGNPRDQIASLMSTIVPYTPRYIRKLLPDEYKQESKSRDLEEKESEMSSVAELVPQIPTTDENITPPTSTTTEVPARFDTQEPKSYESAYHKVKGDVDIVSASHTESAEPRDITHLDQSTSPTKTTVVEGEGHRTENLKQSQEGIAASCSDRDDNVTRPDIIGSSVAIPSPANSSQNNVFPVKKTLSCPYCKKGITIIGNVHPNLQRTILQFLPATKEGL